MIQQFYVPCITQSFTELINILWFITFKIQKILLFIKNVDGFYFKKDLET